MKVPHTIPKSACNAYKPSKVCLNYPGEPNRILKAELLSWDDALPKSLCDLSVEAIIKHFKEIQVFDVIPLEKDRNLLLEMLPLDLPLRTVIPIIPDGVYWQRRAIERWPTPIEGTCNIAKHNNSWKQLYLERDLQEWIEKLIPGDEPELGVMGPNGWGAWQNNAWVNENFGKNLGRESAASEESLKGKVEDKKDMFGPDDDIDGGKQVFESGGNYKDQFPESGEEDEDDEEEDEEVEDVDDEMSEDLILKNIETEVEEIPKTTEKVSWAADYIYHLNLQELQVGHMPQLPPEDSLHNCIAEPPPTDHIDLGPILSKLENLQELSIEYKVRNIGIDFSWHYFTISMADMVNLGRGLRYCPQIKILRLKSSNMDDEKLITLLQSLIEGVPYLEIFDLSHNNISDNGVIALAKFIPTLTCLKNLILCNNKIGSPGIESLSSALGTNASSLVHLNLRLNFLIGEDGGALLSSALHSNNTITSLVLAASGLESKAGILMGEMLKYNSTLIELDLSNNDLGEEAGEALEQGLETNTTLQKLDLRMTKISQETEFKISQALARNSNIRANKEAASNLCKILSENFHSIPSEKNLIEEEVAEDGCTLDNHLSSTSDIEATVEDIEATVEEND